MPGAAVAGQAFADQQNGLAVVSSHAPLAKPYREVILANAHVSAGERIGQRLAIPPSGLLDQVSCAHVSSAVQSPPPLLAAAGTVRESLKSALLTRRNDALKVGSP